MDDNDYGRMNFDISQNHKLLMQHVDDDCAVHHGVTVRAKYRGEQR
jgi:hypothetical protein